MNAKLHPNWPVLKRYDGRNLRRIAMPLGGIGTGTVALGGRGDLRDWEVANRPAKGFTPEGCFFALWARPAGGEPVARCLEGAIPPEDYEGSGGCAVANHGLPRFRDAAFAAAYPLAQVLLADPDVPLTVRIEAFNPLVPADAEASGIPLAVLRFVLGNPGDRAVAAAVCGSMLNFIGADGSAPAVGFCGAPDHLPRMRENVNAFRKAGRLSGLLLGTRREDRSPAVGTMALAAVGGASATHRTAWGTRKWGAGLLDFWDDFASDGRLEPRDGAEDPPHASLAVPVHVPAGGEKSVTFLLGWHFPNRRTWTPACGHPAGATPDDVPEEDIVGNHYATRYADAWDVLARTAGRLGELERRTVRFVGDFCGADVPAEVAEAALFNLSTLRSQTCFRTADGHFYGFEGCCDSAGCCHGSCTHVWNYEHASAHLFGELAADQREIELLHMTDPDTGWMTFRVNLPLDRAREFPRAAADGQMGSLMKLYRRWRLDGDDDWLRRLWPAARKAMEFCWVPGGWDADRDGVMEGCQHNTMDVEYYGPNPQMGAWYLGALRACEEIARHLGEDDFADECARLFRGGSAWIDEHLFHGEYYEHQVRPAPGPDAIADGLRSSMGPADPTDPDLQLGPGCLVDQLVGQVMAHVCGLGHLLDKGHIRRALRAIHRHNLRKGLEGHFCSHRSFALNDETGLLMATYPHGRRPARPFPYATEVMTGFEYTAAVGMLQEGQTKRGLQCIRAVRDRYDGRKRNPFDEAECGHHYARAMASWAAMLAVTGFQYSAVTGELAFAATRRPATFFFSTGRAWGTLAQRPARGGRRCELTVAEGRLALRRLRVGKARWQAPRKRTLRPSTTLEVMAEEA